MIDTCQAESMFQRFYSPNILSVASSHVGEDSLSVSTHTHTAGCSGVRDKLPTDFFFFLTAGVTGWTTYFSCSSMLYFNFFQHHVDPAIGVYIIDRYTYYALVFLEKITPDSDRTMAEFVSKNCLHAWPQYEITDC